MTAGKMVFSDASGDFTLDAAIVTQGFGWSPQELHDHMRRRLVTSMVERGEGEDAGFWRLSICCGNRRWRAVVSPNGTITRQHVEYTRGRA